MALDDSLQTRSNLLAALLKSPAAIGVLRGDGDRLISLDLSPDERTLAFLYHDGTLSFVDTRTRRPVGRPITIPGLAGVIIDAVRQARLPAVQPRRLAACGRRRQAGRPGRSHASRLFRAADPPGEVRLRPSLLA